MRSRHHRSRTFGTLAALALLGAAAGLSTAMAASASPTPIGPHQLFLGQVNGVTTGAVIKVGCNGPVLPDQTGHPLAGQTVAVALALAVPVGADTGRTGDAADRINVAFGVPVSVGQQLSLTAYGVKAAIPISLNLPCSGAGKVAFVPAPTSATAVSATVVISYVGVGVSPAP
jgi:hypothetical protein